MRNTRDLQNSVLGALLLKPSLFVEVSNLLHPSMFDEKVKPIAEAIWGIKEKGQGYTIAIISDETNNRKLVNEVVQKANFPHIQEHAHRISKGWLTNQYLEIIQGATRKLFEGQDYYKVVSEAEAQREMYEGMIHVEETLYDAVKAANQMIEDMLSPGLSGIDTGFADLNAWTGGFRPGKLIIVAARSGFGKTTVALQYLTTACKMGKRCAFFSMEMTEHELLFEIALQETGQRKIDYINKQVNDYDKESVFEKNAEIFSWPIHLIDMQRCPPIIQQILDKARRLNEMEKLDMIFVDYLQLLSSYGSFSSRAYELGNVSKLLKMLSIELQIPIIALAQINRDAEKRGGDKRPYPVDIKDSDQILQDADLIELLYRPEKYNILEDEHSTSLKGIMESIIAKNRFLGTIGEGPLYRQWKDGKYHMIKKNVFGELERLEDKEKGLPEFEKLEPIQITGIKVNTETEVPFE